MDYMKIGDYLGFKAASYTCICNSGGTWANILGGLLFERYLGSGCFIEAATTGALHRFA